jgi:hypothetical protein
MKNMRVSVILMALLSWQWVVAQPTNAKVSPATLSVSLGATAQFTVSVTSTNFPVTYQWWFKDAALDAVANPSAAKLRLSLTNVTLAEGGSYFAVVTDQGGSATSQVATLTVDPTFTKITTGPVATDNDPSICLAWWDYDNDGCIDLFVANYSKQNDCLYRNNGNGRFTKMTTNEVGLMVGDSADSVACAWADYDNDGFLDLYVLNDDANGTTVTASFLDHNNGNSNAWLTVKPIGTVSNRQGIGVKIRTLATYAGKPHWQRRDTTGGDVLNGNQLYAHFGLGDATNVTSLRIEWPSGTVEELTNVASRQILTIVEPSLGGAFGTDGLFHLTMTGNTNQTYQLSASSDLLNWTTLTNCAGPGPNTAIEVCDPAAGQAQRFYRLGAP